MASLIFNIILCISLVFLALCLNQEVHEDLDNPWLFRIASGLITISSSIDRVLSYFVSEKELLEINLRTSIKVSGSGGLDESIIKERKIDLAGVPAYIYEPRTQWDSTVAKPIDMLHGGATRPLLVYTHGGGFRLYDAHCARWFMHTLADRLQMAILTIDYRQAPEVKAPMALEDSLDAVKYLFSNAEKLGYDSKNIGIIGDSAGGNLAAAMSLWFRDNAFLHQFSYQILIYPWLQAVDFNIPSYKNERYNNDVLKLPSMASFSAAYAGVSLKEIPHIIANKHTSKSTKLRFSKLNSYDMLPSYLIPEGWKEEPAFDGEKSLVDIMDPFVSNSYNFPLMSENLAGLPPSLIYTCDSDTLRDEGILYAKRMEKDGSAVKLINDKTCFHGVMSIPLTPWRFNSNYLMLDAITDYLKGQQR